MALSFWIEKKRSLNPGGPVDDSMLMMQGHRFDPCSGTQEPCSQKKKKKKKREREQRSHKYLSSAESIMGDGSMMMPLNKTRRKIR